MNVNSNNWYDFKNQATIIRPQNGMGAIPDEMTKEYNTNFKLPFKPDEEYVATTVLSEGGMGTTYLGVEESSNNRVVIKIPKSDQPELIEMFQRECELLADLNHPNIVPIRKTGKVTINNKERSYLIMDFIDGQSLKQKLQTEGQLSWEACASVLLDMCHALEYLHSKQICHRDIKPDNIIWSSAQKKWVLVDFGVAKSSQDVLLAAVTLVQGRDTGTWDYMAPEQHQGKVVDIRCDIYALGTVIWQCLIGAVPRRGSKLPSAAGVDVPHDVDILISKMVEYDIECRYQTPTDVLTAFKKGAQNIENWKMAQQVAQKIRYWGIRLGILAVAVVAAWFVGNEVAEQKLEDVWRSDINDITKKDKLDKIKEDLYLGWGNSWWAEHEDNIKDRANTEEERYREELKNVQSIRIEGLDSEADMRKADIQLQNFLSKWEIKQADADYIEQKTKLTGIKNQQILKKELAFLDELATDIDKLAKESDVSIIKKQIDEGRHWISTPTGHARLATMEKNFLSKAKDSKLEEVQSLIQYEDSPEKWERAYELLQYVEANFGAAPQLKKQLSDKVFSYYNGLLEKAIKENNPKGAERSVNEYAQSKSAELAHIEKFKITLNKYSQIVAEQRDYRDTIEQIMAYQKAKAFDQAIKTAYRFMEKYPQSTSFEQLTSTCASIFTNWNHHLCSANFNQPNDVIIEEYSKALEHSAKYPEIFKNNHQIFQDNIYITVASSIHNIAFSDYKDDIKIGKIDNTNRYHYNKCTSDQSAYLNELVNHATKYISHSSDYNRLKLIYYYERHTNHYVHFPKKTDFRIRWVVIKDVTVTLGSNFYSRLKGCNNCDPIVKIYYCDKSGNKEGSAVLSKLAPINSKRFTVTFNEGILLDTSKHSLMYQIEDDDTFDRATPEGVYNPKPEHLYSKDSYFFYDWNEGTSIFVNFSSN